MKSWIYKGYGFAFGLAFALLLDRSALPEWAKALTALALLAAWAIVRKAK